MCLLKKSYSYQVLPIILGKSGNINLKFPMGKYRYLKQIVFMPGWWYHKVLDFFYNVFIIPISAAWCGAYVRSTGIYFPPLSLTCERVPTPWFWWSDILISTGWFWYGFHYIFRNFIEFDSDVFSVCKSIFHLWIHLAFWSLYHFLSL